MRLFFGLSLPADIRAAAAACAAQAQGIIPGRYTPEENYHITLAFIGEVPENRLGDAHAVLQACIRDFPAPRVTLLAPDHFGRAQNGILILRAASSPALEPLHEHLVRALASVNLPADPGPFAPHITLARHADVTRGLPPIPPPLSFTAQEAHVFLSARNDQGALAYTPITSAPFASDSL